MLPWLCQANPAHRCGSRANPAFSCAPHPSCSCSYCPAIVTQWGGWAFTCAWTLAGKWKMPVPSLEISGPHPVWCNTPSIPLVQCVLWKQLPTHLMRPQTEGRERKEHYLCSSAQTGAMHISCVQSSLEDHPSSSWSQTQHGQGSKFLYSD